MVLFVQARFERELDDRERRARRRFEFFGQHRGCGGDHALQGGVIAGQGGPVQQQGAFVEDEGRLILASALVNHDRAGQPQFDQVGRQAEWFGEPLPRRTRGLDHVHLDVVQRKTVQERPQHVPRVLSLKDHREEKIDSEDAQGFLLAVRIRVAETGMDHHVAGGRTRSVLELHADPAVALVVSFVASRGDRVGEDKETCPVAAGRRQALGHCLVLIGEHFPEPFAGDRAVRLSVQGLAHGPVVRGDGLGNGPGCAPDAEEPA